MGGRPASEDGALRFRLLASSLAGRSVEMATAGQDEQTWTDGVTIFLDARPPAADQLFSVAVQAALMRAGSLSSDIVAALSRRPALAQRYLAVEGHRALAQYQRLLPTRLEMVIDHTVATRARTPAASLALARSREPLPAVPACFGALRPKQVRPPTAPGEDGQPGEGAFRQVQTERLTEYVDEEHDDDTSVDVSSPVGGGGAIGKLLQRMLGTGPTSGSGAAGAHSPTHWTRRAGSSLHFLSTRATADASEAVDAVHGHGVTYPEWDVSRRRYREAWCTVRELEVTGAETLPFSSFSTHALRRPLAKMGLDVERRHRQPQGNDIDIDATVEARVELRSGATPSDAIYIDDVRRRRDLSVLLLLDISGSAGEASATGPAVHEHQRDAAGCLTAVLHELGDRVALYAFRSMGRSNVEILPVKRFSEPFGSLVLRRLGALVPGAYTRLGAAIRHGATVLERDGGTARRLLIVLSDGFAYDHGYGGAYGEADARRALAEARRSGTACLCLSVGAMNDVDALRRVFGTAAHARLMRMDQLPDVVGPLARAALRSAEAQRRTWQRTERARERSPQQRRPS
jgi:nitric oxide reductase NorD protein